MSEKEKQPSIAELIDADEGLKVQRRKLVTVSVILLGIQFTGLEIIEANTFFFKMSFSNQDGLGLFLSACIIFLMIRYYNYASPYHQELYNKWSNRLLSKDCYWAVCPHSDETSGLVSDLMPERINFQEVSHNGWKLDWQLQCHFPLKRSIQYRWGGEHDDYQETKVIRTGAGWRKYFQLLNDEWFARTGSLLKDREQLDIIGPYLLGLAALASLWLYDVILNWFEFIKNFFS